MTKIENDLSSVLLDMLKKKLHYLKVINTSLHLNEYLNYIPLTYRRRTNRGEWREEAKGGGMGW